MARRICFIGNNGNGKPVHDGQHGKVRLYLELLKEEGFDVDFIELDGWKRHPISLFFKIKKGIKNCDVILLMAAQKGARLLIPFINRWNKKNHKKFVYSNIGIGIIKLKTIKDTSKFYLENDFTGYNDYSFAKELSKIDLILPETNIIKSVYEHYYHLNNCLMLTNFKDIHINLVKHDMNGKLKLVYMARINREKGILKLLEAIKDVDGVTLDVYGVKQFNNNEDEQAFNDYINSIACVFYKGSIDVNDVMKTLSEYDALVFPTCYVGEGVPGTVVESLISGLPVISSKFVQSSELLKDGVDSLLFDVGDVEGLREKIIMLRDNRELLKRLSEGAYESGKRFTYEYNRDLFLKIFNED